MPDIMDTRDEELMDRYEELRNRIEEAEEAWADSGTDEPKPTAATVLTDLDDHRDWLDLEYMENNIADFWHGETLVHEDYFTEYAEELAYELGTVNRDAAWPTSYIDWEAAAEALKMDYVEVEWQGETYLAR